MIASVVMFVSVFILGYSLLSLLLPGFAQQRKLSTIATLLIKTDQERARMRQNPFILSLSDQVEKKKWLFSILGPQLKTKYDLLGRKESFAIYTAQTILYGLLAAVGGLLRYAMSPEPIYLVLPFVLFFLVCFLRNQKITKDYAKRQSSLISDLPNLINKMTSALEIGKPLTDIFRKVVAEGDNPLLSALLKKLLANTEAMPIQEALQIFAKDINLPVIYDFVGVVNIVIEKGFREAEKELNGIKNDLRELRMLSLREQTKGNPGKMNIFYVLLLLQSGVFFILCAWNIGKMLTSAL